MHKVKGVVVRAKNEPATLETVLVPDPGPGEALVDVLTCGVCQTDLHYKVGGVGDDFPYLLGHEAAGVVSAVGEGVTEVEVGDHVILNWRAVCGECRACRRGEPWYCFNTHNATQKMTLEDGTELSPALGIGAFAEKTLVAAGQCTKVDPSARAAAVGLLGCGVMAGIGAAINTGAVTRGKSVAVIGCGGVGVAAIAGSALAGASTIIAVDIDAKKLEKARTMGATHTVDSSATDPVTAIQELTGGFGADVVIEAVGRPETWKQAFYARDLAGTVVLVGVPTPDMKVPDIPLIDVRETDEYAAGHVPGAVNLPMSTIGEHLDELPEGPFDVICAMGGRSARVVEALEARGHDVTNVDGGTNGWAAEGYPLDRP